EPLAVPEVLREAAGHDVVVFDCLTLWLANLLLNGREPEAVLRRVEELADVLRHRPVHAIGVHHRGGLRVGPETPLGGGFRDLAGLAHQRRAALADEVYCGAMGLMLRIKPGPVAPAGEPEA